MSSKCIMSINKYKSLGFIQLIVAISAIPAGLSFLIDPSGLSMGISNVALSGTPFSDFYVPGLFLLIVHGIFNIAGAILTFRRSIYTRVFGMILGSLLVGWICIQVYFIGLNHFLQPLFLLVGLGEILLSYSILSNNKD